MKNHRKIRSGIAIVVLFFLLAIMVISAVESLFFYEKFTTIETLEALHNRVNHISRVVARLGNTLDIVVVGQRFEQTTINILLNDVDRIDAEIGKMYNQYSKDSVTLSNKKLSDELKGVPKAWKEIAVDMKKLRADMTHDEVMIVHNDIDVDVLVLDEKLDLISSGINAGLKRVFHEIKILLVVSLSGVILILAAAAIFLYFRFLAPMQRLENAAIAMAGGSGERRFNHGAPGVFGRVAREVNTVLEGAEKMALGLEEEIGGLRERIRQKEEAIAALADFFMESGRSFDTELLMKKTLRKIPAMTGAFCVLFYMPDGDKLKLRAWDFGGEKELTPPAVIAAEAFDDGSGVAVEAGAPGAPAFAAALSSCGARWLSSYSIGPGDGEDHGRLILLFRNPPDDDKAGFIRALAISLGATTAFIKSLCEEHAARENCLTLINQFPLGIAVFERGGACILANLILKRFLGAGSDFDFVKDYTFSDDDILCSQGLVTTIRKAYDGFITEFIISYDPRLVRRYGFRGEVRDLRVRSVPLYDPDGLISRIAMIYEDITITDEPVKGKDNTPL